MEYLNPFVGCASCCNVPLVVKFIFLFILFDLTVSVTLSPCRTIRAISSDRGKVVSGSDDQSVIVWDKQTSQLLEELKGHDAQVCLFITFWIANWVYDWNVPFLICVNGEYSFCCTCWHC